MANELKQVYGSATTVIDLTADLTNTSVAGGTAALDNTTNNYPWALAVFSAPGTFSAAPTNLSTVNLYMVRQNTEGTDEDTATPTGSDVESAQFVGAFLIYDSDEVQRVSIVIDIAGVTNALFYIENKTGVTITGNSSHIYVKVTPFSYAPT
jgi:hypothetical protein